MRISPSSIRRSRRRGYWSWRGFLTLGWSLFFSCGLFRSLFGGGLACALLGGGFARRLLGDGFTRALLGGDFTSGFLHRALFRRLLRSGFLGGFLDSSFRHFDVSL